MSESDGAAETDGESDDDHTDTGDADEPFGVDDGDHMRIAVDFDDTLSEGEEDDFTAEPSEPDEEAVHWVNEQYRKGHTVIVWTARPWDSAAETVARLTEWGVHWHGLRMEKGHADVYVDDKGTTPSDQLLKDGYDGDGELDAEEVARDPADLKMNGEADDLNLDEE
ncbi:hypothetical protein ACFO0N_17485 [Halobium salinum]|uniref:Capsular biosynthesis protein n=1 Tax=Halobium salinum TaxID=1364940 RepID=A0ABD5PFQ8_9EURY|nr:hypothetical protein [Halobium salinum]